MGLKKKRKENRTKYQFPFLVILQKFRFFLNPVFCFVLFFSNSNITYSKFSLQKKDSALPFQRALAFKFHSFEWAVWCSPRRSLVRDVGGQRALEERHVRCGGVAFDDGRC